MVNTAILVSTAKARKAELAKEIATIDAFIALFDKTAAGTTTAAPKKAGNSALSEALKKSWAKRKRAAAAKAKAAGASLAEAAA